MAALADSTVIERNPLTLERLKAVVHYEPATGVFTRLIGSKQARAGEHPGSADNGYLKIGIDGRKYRAHRLAWFYLHGEWPPIFIDHIDRDRNNNKASNLRCVTKAENCRNRSAVSGKFVGTAFQKQTGKWTAQIRSNGKNYHLGYFRCETAAHLAYLKAKPKFHTIGSTD